MAGEDVFITIAGDSAPLVSSLADASAAFGDMAVAAGSSSDDIAASMAALASAIQDLAAEVDMLSASMDNLAASSGTAAAGVEEAGASANTATAEALGLSDAVDTLTGAWDALMGSVTPLIATLGTLIAVMGAMVIINDVSSWIENLIQQMFQLDQTTQRVVTSWRYLFQSVGAAQQMAGWAYQESPKLPFTAMDLRSAVSTLGAIPGMTPSEIEKFIPTLADIASTLGASDYGGQGITLQQSAQAIQSASFGLTRMLRSELHIPPQELIKYGLAAKATATGIRITDFSTLIPAIEKWSAARGLSGAAGIQATQTFWGAYSSFQDYIQNALQTMGGINPATGNVVPGSMFGNISKILYGVNAALSNAQSGHGGLIQGIEGGVGNVLGGGVQGGISFVQGMLQGLTSSGAGKLGTDFLKAFEAFGTWLQSKPVQADIEKIGKAFGDFAGQVAQITAKAIPDFEKAVGMLVKSLEDLWNSMSPQQQQAIKSIGSDILEVIGAFIAVTAAVIELAAKFNAAINGIADTVRSWGANLAAQFKKWGSDFIEMLMEGIKSKLGDFGGLINHIGQQIANKLHFSKPDEGPLADSDRWMPDMMIMFAEGIERGLPRLARASQQAATAIAFPMHYASHPGIGGGVSNSYGSTTNYGASSTSNTFYGGNSLQMEMMIREALENLDRNGALITAAPGGRFIFGGH